MKELVIKGKRLNLPTFFPDATRGVIRSIDAQDLKSTGTPGVVVNTYHLMTHPGAELVKGLGGIKRFMDWDGFVISDSGGFQLMSLIQQNPAFGKINNDGIIFYRGSTQNQRKYTLTPEKAIQIQFALGADIMICLDAFTPVVADKNTIRESVDRTIIWAKRCKEEFDRQIKQRKLNDETRPLLFGVIQGGDDQAERRRCANGLTELGFDGFGFGGWPFKSTGELDRGILQLSADLMPDHLPKYALGVGNPDAVVACAQMGYTIFDCVLPTRDARHKRLYVFTQPLDQLEPTQPFWTHLHIHREKYVRDPRPISAGCECHTCQHYSRAYLNHLFAVGDVLAFRLATIHNLHFYAQLIKRVLPYYEH